MRPSKRTASLRYQKTHRAQINVRRRYIHNTDPSCKQSHFSRVLKYRYGITLEEFNSMVLKSEGRCAICGATGDLHVDHDHITGKVRGLLCNLCNPLLGYAKENPIRLREAAKYLEMHADVAIQT